MRVFRTGRSLGREPVLYRHPDERRRACLDGRRAELGAERVARSADGKATAMDPEDDRDWTIYLRRVDDQLDAFGRRLERRGPVLRSGSNNVQTRHAPSRLRTLRPSDLCDAVQAIQVQPEPRYILQQLVDELETGSEQDR